MPQQIFRNSSEIKDPFPWIMQDMHQTTYYARQKKTVNVNAVPGSLYEYGSIGISKI